jgi:hypothetical protein
VNAAASLENVYHTIMLENCEDEEAKQWENARHAIMSESITDTCNYYAKCYRFVEKEEELER